MTAKISSAASVARISGTMTHTPGLARQNQFDPDTHNDQDLWDDIESALTEKDIQVLRAKLKEISHMPFEAAPDGLSGEFLFDLTHGVATPGEWQEFDGLLPDFSEVTQALPKIHLHHHKRCMNETIHHYYLEQAAPMSREQDPLSAEVEDPEWQMLEEAMTEGDVMDLRQKLQLIAKTASTHPYGVSDMEDYLNEEMDPGDRERFEEELAFNPQLSDDLDLNLELEEAIGEQDVMALREALGGVMRHQKGRARSIADIDSFLEGSMTGDDREAFMEEMAGNRELRREIRLSGEMEKALGEQDVIALRDKLREVADSEEKVVGRGLVAPPKVSGVKQLATVAAVALLVMGFFSLQTVTNLTNRNVYEAFYKAPPAPSNFRDVAATPADGLTQGFLLFNHGQYASALLLLREEANREPFNPAAVFYTGASHQGLKEYSQAVAQYDRILLHRDNLFVEQAEWYAALSLVGSHQFPEATGRLNAVVNRRGYYARDAEKLLSRIRKGTQ